MSIIKRVNDDFMDPKTPGQSVLAYAVARTIELFNEASPELRAEYLVEAQSYFDKSCYAVVCGDLEKGVRKVFGPFDKARAAAIVKQIWNSDDDDLSHASVHKIGRRASITTPVDCIEHVKIDIDYRGIRRLVDIAGTGFDPNDLAVYPLEPYA